METIKQKSKILLAAALYLCVFGWFLVCAAPTLYWGDSAEMTSVACSAGVAHSPGYPLFSLTARLFLWLPTHAAFAANIMSVFFAAAAVVGLFLFLARISGSLFAALAGALLLAGVPAFVFHSLFIEVYAFHLFLFMAVLLAADRHEQTGDVRWFLATMVLLSLGMAHHILMYFLFVSYLLYCIFRPGHTQRTAAVPLMLFFGYSFYNLMKSHNLAPSVRTLYLSGLAVLAAVWITYLIILAVKRKRAFQRAVTGAAAALFIFAAITFVFAYLPLVSARHPVADWWSPSTPANFLNLLFLKGYPPTFPDNVAELMRRADLLGLMVQVAPAALVAAAIGIIVIFARRAHLALLLTATGAATMIGALLVKHGKPEALRLPVYVVLIILAVVAVGWVLSWRFWKGALWRRALALPLYAGVLFVLIGALLHADMRAMARSGGAYELGARIIEQVEPDGVVFIGAQTPGIMAYFAACEPDKLEDKNIAVLPVAFFVFDWKIKQLRRDYPDLSFPDAPRPSRDGVVFDAFAGYGVDYAARFMTLNEQRGAFYSDYYFAPPGSGYTTVPQDVVYRIVPDTEEALINELLERDTSPEWSRVDIRDELAARNIASVHNERGKTYLHLARFRNDPILIQCPEDKVSCEDRPSAMREFDRAIKIYPRDAEAFTNRGQAKLFLGDEDGAVKDMEYAAMKLKPDNPDVYNIAAETLLQRHTRPATNRALQFLAMSEALKPGQPKVLFHFGAAYTMLQQTRAALGFYQKAIERDPNYVEAYLALSRLYEAAGDCANSIGYLEEIRDRLQDAGPAVSGSFRSLDLQSELAIRYYTCGFSKLFNDHIESMFNNFEHDLNFFQSIGTVYREVGRIDQTIRLYNGAVQKYPDYRLYRLFESLIYGDCSRSIPMLENAVRLAPRDFSLRFGFASTLALCNLPTEAHQQLLIAKRIDPNEQGVAPLLNELYTQFRKQNLDVFKNGAVNIPGAIAFYEDALKGQPAAGSVQVLRVLARLYAAQGDCEHSVALLEEATEKLPDSIELQGELVRRYAACGRKDELPDAMENLRKGFNYDYNYYLAAGSVLRDIGNVDLAVRMFYALKTVLPNIRLADLFMECGRGTCDSCLPQLARAADIAVDELSIHVRRANALCDCGKTDACRAEKKTANRLFTPQAAGALLEELPKID